MKMFITDLSKHSKLKQYVPSDPLQQASRRKEMELRKQIADLQNQLNDKANLTNSLRKKLLKSEQRTSKLVNERKKLNRKILYCYKFVKNVKEKVSQVRNHHDKNLLKPLLSSSFGNRHRAPVNKLSQHNTYYVKKSKISVQNETRKRKQCQKLVDLKRKVIEFYENDENSSTTPGVRDFFRKGGTKKRKSYLNDTIGNLYLKYCKESTMRISQ